MAEGRGGKAGGFEGIGKKAEFEMHQEGQRRNAEEEAPEERDAAGIGDAESRARREQRPGQGVNAADLAPGDQAGERHYRHKDQQGEKTGRKRFSLFSGKRRHLL